MEFQCKLYLARRARGRAKYLTERTAGQNQIAIGNGERRRICRVLSFHAQLEIARFIEMEALAKGQVEIEEWWPGKEIATDVAEFAGLGTEELRALSGREENILIVFQNDTSKVG